MMILTSQTIIKNVSKIKSYTITKVPNLLNNKTHLINNCVGVRNYLLLNTNKSNTTKRTLLENFVHKTPQQKLIRYIKTRPEKLSSKSKGSKTTLFYLGALGVLTAGMSYAAVPLYRIFCQSFAYGGTVQEGHDAEKVESMKRVEDRQIKIKFNADIGASMTWNFRPQQKEIIVAPGETALAFYTAMNPTDKPVIGVSTYNVLPFDAGQYFNKIQCFCFEEQMLNPHEEVYMPVFFYIDPEYADDPKMENVDVITLSYTFFESKEGMNLPVPSFARN